MPWSHPSFLTLSRLLLTQALLLGVLRGPQPLIPAGTWGEGGGTLLGYSPSGTHRTHTGWEGRGLEAAWLRHSAWSMGLVLLGSTSVLPREPAGPHTL